MPNSTKKAPARESAFPHNMMRQDYLGPAVNESKAASGMRQSHDQMERNFHNDRDKAAVKGQSTTPPKK